MKTYYSILVALAFPAALQAGDQTAATEQTTTVTPAPAAVQPGAPIVIEGQPTKMAAPDRFLMSSGSVAAVRGKDAERLTNDVKLLDGTVLTTGGTVRRQDGSETQLADGQSISMDGKLSPVARAVIVEPGASENIQVIKPQ